MVKSSHLGELDDVAQLRRFDIASQRRIAGQ
jgi:hypothetical protein